MLRPLVSIGCSLAIVLAGAGALAQTPPPAPLTHAPIEATVATATPPTSFGGKVLATVESPVARHLVASALAPVPRAVVRDVGEHIVGSRGATARIEKLDDAALSRMSAPELAHLATPLVRANFLQRFTNSQR
jgi:hypothetical protein